MIKGHSAYVLRITGYLLIVSSINLAGWSFGEHIVVAGFSLLAGVVLVYSGNSINEIQTPYN